MAASKRPYVICHMVPSVDGRIVTTPWKKVKAPYNEAYEKTAKTFRADAWMIGRISMEGFTAKGKVAKPKGSVKRLPRTDFIAPHEAKSFAVGLDPSGKLVWKSGYIDDEHVISVLTEKVSDAYLSFLREKGVSYVFGGKTEVDLKRVLEKLRAHFGIEKLLLEGGGSINGSFLAAGLIDELSLLVCPVADGSVGTPALFDAGKGVFQPLKLLAVKKLGDIAWLRYTR